MGGHGWVGDLPSEDDKLISVLPEFLKQITMTTENFKELIESTIEGYDLFLDGDSKGEFVGGIGGFVYVDANGIPDVTFQCPIDELDSKEDVEVNGRPDIEGSVYGFSSIASKYAVEYEYQIDDLNGQNIMKTTDLKEPYRSQFVYEWFSRNGHEFGRVDETKIRLAYHYYNTA